MLILHPALNPSSFVLLFTKGEAGQSWSIRDYSDPNGVSVRYAREFPFSLEELRAQAAKYVEAPATSAADLAFWHNLTCETNAKYQLPVVSSRPASENPQQEVAFPVLRLERLMGMPKSRKAQDMKRILMSPNSEDWVTRNAFALAEELVPISWWKHLLSLATQENPRQQPYSIQRTPPSVTLWRSTPAPALMRRLTEHECESLLCQQR